MAESMMQMDSEKSVSHSVEGHNKAKQGEVSKTTAPTQTEGSLGG